MPHQDFFMECRPEDSRAKITHLTMYRGDTMQLKFVLKEDLSTIDITGAHFWWTVKDDINDNDADAIFMKELGNGIEVPYPQLGQVVITLEPSETIALQLEEARTYYWDLQYQDELGVVQTVFVGKLTILLDVTENQGFIVGSGGLIIVNQLQGNSFVAGVNDVADGDGLTINEQQSMHVTGATGGTFTLTADDPNNPGFPETTGALAWNETAANIKAALETDISFIDTVTVTGGDLDVAPVVVEFTGAGVTLLNFDLMTMDVSLLT